MPRQYVAKPQKVQAEQYLVATQPPLPWVCTLHHDVFPDGRPHVHVMNFGAVELHDTDMVIWSQYDVDVILDVQALAEFEDRYGNVPGTVEG